MAAFSATDAAFEGFRITRERPMDVIAWVVLFVVFQAALLMIIGPVMGEFMAEMTRQMQSGAQPSPERMVAMYSRMGPAYAILTPLSLIVQTLMMCAVYRAVLRPDERGIAGFRLGGDEFRVLAVTFAINLLLMGGLFLSALVLGILSGALGWAAGATAGILVAVVLGVIVICAVVYVAVRLSLAMPMTFAARDFRVFESWRATKDRFWGLLGAYLLALVMGMLVSILISIIGAAAIAGTIFATGATPASANPASTFDPAFFSSPVAWVTVVFQGISSAFFSVLLYAPPAAALRQLRATGQAFD